MNSRTYGIFLAAFLSVALSFLGGCASSGSSQPPPPTVAIAATSGSGQTAAVGATFAKPMVATVTSGGSPAAGVSVIFTAPAAQPNATFAGAVATDTETTDANGVATSKAFTAGTKAGSYSVSAMTSGATTPASFSLSNSAGAATGISTAAGATQSAVISIAFATALQATVVDSDSNPVSGVAVTFTAPSSGASGTFTTSGKNTETDSTGANGVATASAFKANGTTGGPDMVTANFSSTWILSFRAPRESSFRNRTPLLPASPATMRWERKILITSHSWLHRRAPSASSTCSLKGRLRVEL